MTLTIARFDLDETPREPNTIRPKPSWSPLPIGFPFLVDKESGEVDEPALAFLMHKCAGAQAYRSGKWKKKATADAYAADLKDWMAKVAASGRPWHQADDELVESYLLDMRLELSEHTEDFLADSTIGRRRSTLNEFHKFARRRYGHQHLPVASTRGLTDYPRDENGEETFDAFELARYDANPRPIADEDVPRLAEALGPRPGEARAGFGGGKNRTANGRPKYLSSRTRLAFEIAFAVGLRVDEIVHLRADFFERIDTAGKDEDDNLDFELDHTKGLVRRTVYFPYWLVDLLKAYIAGERQDAIKAARRNWLGKKAKPHPNLFLNSPAAGRNAGKRTATKQIEADFHKAVTDLKLLLPRKKAEGTEHEQDVEVAAHSFHDGRHSFAYGFYRERMGELDGDEPVLERRFEDVVQALRLRLGHQQVETTINIYLRVFNREGEKALRRLSRWARAVISRDRKNA